MPYCPACAETCEQEATFCPACGSELADGGSSANSSDGWTRDDGIDATDGWGRNGETDTTEVWERDGEVDATSSWGHDSTDSTDRWSNEEDTSQWGVDDFGTSEITTAAAHHEARDAHEPPDSVQGQTEPASPSRTGPRYHDIGLLNFAVTFPIGKRGRPLLLDSVSVFLWFLVLPLFVSYGYSYRVGRAAARGDPDPPSFDDWGGLAKDGVVLVGVVLATFVAFAIVSSVLDAGGAAMGDSSLSQLYDAFVVLGAFVGLYLAGAIVPVLIGTGSLTETFGEFQFVRFALTGHYLKGVVATIGLAVVGYVLFLFLVVTLAFTVVGLLLVIPLLFVYPIYLVNVLFALWGHVYNQAAKAGDVDPVQPEDFLRIS